MVWSSGHAQGGFTDGKPWLPIAKAHLERAVDAQEEDPDSLLNHYRKFIAFRRQHPALRSGSIEIEDHGDGVFCFLRRHADETIFCAFNLTDEQRVLDRPGQKLVPLQHSGFSSHVDDGTIKLPALGACFASLE